MSDKLIIPTANTLKELMDRYGSIFNDKKINVVKILSSGEQSEDGNMASIQAQAPGKLGYFSLWSHGSVDAVIVDEKTLKELHRSDYCTENVETVEVEFERWITSF